MNGKSCPSEMVDFRSISSVETSQAAIKVDAGLPVGKYIFQLTVIDERGNKSKPVRMKLEITRRFVGPIQPRRNGRF